uniref:Sugar phosphate exchanger 3 n=1 Tax=Macrostomum lignano TaxID=282301 RepID=A0A1I8I4U1_9PLAT
MPTSVFPYNVQYDSGTVRRRFFMYQSFILVFTFACYTAYHLSRKPISVVKSVLHRDCSAIAAAKGIKLTNENKSFCSWKPFDEENYNELLGSLEYAYLFAYAIGMLVSGHIAERTNLRYYLGCGMLLSGLTTALFGLGYYWDVHSMTYFILVQRAVWCRLLVGQALWLAWELVWQGQRFNPYRFGRRGFIMGVWNSHTSTGNILGSILAGLFVNISWGLSFIVPGALIGFLGLMCLLFLVPYPSDVGLPSPYEYSIEIRTDDEQPSKPPSSVSQSSSKSVKGKTSLSGKLATISESESGDFEPDDEASLEAGTSSDRLPLFDDEETGGGSGKSLNSKDLQAIGFCGALKIPGVIEYSMCLFFAKLLFTYEKFGGTSLTHSIVLLFITGGFVNGPYALITTAVSADLGTACGSSARALATVTAIIDGAGSLGAAFGPLLTGLIVRTGWRNVFYMLIGADLAALSISLWVWLRAESVFNCRQLVSVTVYKMQCSGIRVVTVAALVTAVLLLSMARL